MDIEQIKKLNEMTKTLQKHGLTNNSEESSKLAGEMSHVEMPSENKKEITKDYIELLFERNNRKLMQEINSLKEEISNLKVKLNEKPERIVKEEQKELPKNKREITKEDVKVGRDPADFEDVDVSVENIFYYGKK